MKKQNVINLIKYHVDKNESGFKEEAYEIAKHFDRLGEFQLSEYIMALLSSANTFIPQSHLENMQFLEKLGIEEVNPLPLPQKIAEDVFGIVNAVNHKLGVNKFLFEGKPGTGKTETVKHLARVLDRELLFVNFDTIVDSKLGQTTKNISDLFNEISTLPSPYKFVILFDEIDAIAIDRINSNDVREMGRATSAILKGMDRLNSNIILVATTNLFNSFDKALTRRFDAVINFDRYSKDDLVDVGSIVANEFLKKSKYTNKNAKLLQKILTSQDVLPSPGELKNLIKTSIAFSNPNNGFDYLRKLFTSLNKSANIDIKKLSTEGFSVRDIEILTGIPKSSAARNLTTEDKV